MEWLTQNWVWVALAVGFIGVHLLRHRGHGGHGGHGGHRGGCGGGHRDERRAAESTPQREVDDAGVAARASSRHRH